MHLDTIRCPSCAMLAVNKMPDGTGKCTYCGRMIDADTLSADLELASLERTPPKNPLPSMVYYIRWSDRIKIGTSNNIRERLGKLYHDEVLAVEPGGRELEASRLKQFAEYRLPKYKEWFTVAPALVAHTEALRERHEQLLKAI